MTRKTLATAVVALGVATAVLRCQAQPTTFFKDRIHLPDAEIQKIQQGQVVTKVLESGDAKYVYDVGWLDSHAIGDDRYSFIIPPHAIVQR